MSFLFLLFTLAIIVAMAKALIFWIYLWQLKEYRFDRFWAEYGKLPRLFRFWVFSGGRRIWYPKWTAKSISISLVSLITLLLLLGLISETKLASAVFELFLLFLVYLLTPLVVIFGVVFFKMPTALIKRIIYKKATRKITSMKNLIVVGITGSYGKSSTKEFLAQILSRKFKVARTPENVNSEIGVSKFILDSLIPDTEVLIVEMGAYKIGELKKICDIVKPKIGILTGINEQHLGLFGSLDNIKKAKLELIESLPKDGLAVFNGEDPRVLELAQKWQGKGLIYRHNIVAPKRNMPKHYELNLQGAIDVAKYLGMSEKEIEEAIKNFKPFKNMLKLFTGKNGVLLIDDTYSANPDGVLAALDYLKDQPRKTKIIVMPCLIELGAAAQEVHQKIGRKISDVSDSAIITTPDHFPDIKKGAGDKTVLMENPDRIKSFLEQKLNGQTAVLLEGRIPQNIIDAVLR